MSAFEVTKGGRELRPLKNAERLLRKFIRTEVHSTENEPVEDVVIIGRTKSGTMVYSYGFLSPNEAMDLADRFKKVVRRDS